MEKLLYTKQKDIIILTGLIAILGLIIHEIKVYRNHIYVTIDPRKKTHLVAFGDSLPAGVEVSTETFEVVKQHYGGYTQHLAHEINKIAKEKKVSQEDIVIFDDSHELAFSGHTSSDTINVLQTHLSQFAFEEGTSYLFCGSFGINDLTKIWKNPDKNIPSFTQLCKTYVATLRTYMANCNTIFAMLEKIPSSQILILAVPDPRKAPTIREFIHTFSNGNWLKEQVIFFLIKLGVATFNFPLKNICYKHKIPFHTMPPFDATLVSSIDGFHPSPKGHETIGTYTAREKVVLKLS